MLVHNITVLVVPWTSILLTSLRMTNFLFPVRVRVNGTSILSLGNSTENTSGGQMLPPRIVVNNKLIYTERLVADLRFWVEVER